MDVVYILLTLALFASSLGLIRLCERVVTLHAVAELMGRPRILKTF
jgi:hypothetical protein